MAHTAYDNTLSRTWNCVDTVSMYAGLAMSSVKKEGMMRTITRREEREMEKMEEKRRRGARTMQGNRLPT